MTQVSLSYQLDLDDHSIRITATPSQTAKSSIVYVQELGDFIAGRNYFTRRANLPSYLIKYCISGEGILEYEGDTYAVKPRQLFWIDCEKPQYYRTSPEKGNCGALVLSMANTRLTMNIPCSNSEFVENSKRM
jgi:mannose-6-phosphate isomerase class I